MLCDKVVLDKSNLSIQIFFFYDCFRHRKIQGEQAHMGIAHTIRICDRIGRRLSLLLTCENCVNKCISRIYVME